jgi:CHAT domain-containing protein
MLVPAIITWWRGMLWQRYRLVGLLLAQVCLPILAVGQEIDLALGRTLAEELNSAYIRKDAASVLRLWSEKSPQRSEQQERLKKLFAAGAGIEIRESIAVEPEITGEHARFRVLREIVALPGASDQSFAAQQAGRKVFILDCVKESVGWRIWKETSAEDNLAERLLAVPDEKSRWNLLSENSSLIGLDLVIALLKQGHASYIRGNLTEALKTYQFALGVADKSGSATARSNVLNDTGILHYDRGEYREALECYQQSLRISESLNDELEIARTLGNMGLVYLDEGNYGLAGETFQKGLALGQKVHNDSVVSFALSHLATLFGNRGDYLRAFDYLQQSASLAERTGDKRRLAFSVLNLGQVLEFQGDYAQAKEYYRRGLQLSDAQGFKAGAAYALTSLGRVDEFEDDLFNALDKYEKSLAIANEIGDKPNMAKNLGRIGSVHVAKQEYDKAIESFHKSLAIREEIGAKAEAAVVLAQTAGAQNRRGEFVEALRRAKEALDLANTIGLRETIWRAHLEAGNAYRGLNQPGQAEVELEQAIETIEDLRYDIAGGESEKANFFEDKLEPYHRMIDLLVAAGRDAEAFAYAERVKARALIDVLKFGQVQLSGAMTSPERQREQELRAKMASLNARLARATDAGGDAGAVTSLASDLQRLRLEYGAFQISLYAAHPELRLQRGEVNVVNAADAFKLLPDSETVMVEFVVTGDKIFAFALSASRGKLSPGRLHIYEQPISRKDLSGMVQAFRQQLANRELGFRAAASRLYDLLLKPARPYIRNGRRMILIPDGALWDLPFQALVTSDRKYLLDDYAITYAPSITALQAMAQAKRERRRTSHAFQLLAMGNPISQKQTEPTKNVDESKNLLALPLAESEVRRLGQIYGAAYSRVYVGRDASESRFKSEAPDATVLHLATHGILNNASPLYSHLILAAEKDESAEDGRLEAWELMTMKLRAQLAVLSACETARGRVGAGEGVIGLSWALFASGVPTTVLSQWKVEAASTSKFMVAFHEKVHDGTSEGVALQAAAVILRKDANYQHPFYWAPFIVVGASQ